jgi:hypothetical protein
MKRFGFKGCLVAIVMLVLAGAVAEAGAAEMLQAGLAYGGWGGPMGLGYAGYGGPNYAYAGYAGYPNGYVGGGGWGYSGSCCNNIWAGYCNEMHGCGGCHVRHRHRRLGCGAGPCAQPSCAQAPCGQPACQPTVCGPAPCVRRHGCFLRRRHCGAGCGAGAGCGCNGGGMPMGYDSGMMMDGGTVVPEGSYPAQPNPMPETIEPPAPKPGLDGST